MRKKVIEQKLSEIASDTQKTVSSALSSFKEKSLILNYTTKIIPTKGDSFNIMCTIVLPENKIFYFEIDYVYNRKGLKEEENALKTKLMIGLRILRKGFVFGAILKGIRQRSSGFKKELIVEKVFLPQLKKDKLIVDYKKTKKEEDKKGVDFYVFVNDSKNKVKKIAFDVKSSKGGQKYHAVKCPNISSVAIVEETTYEEFKGMMMLIIHEGLEGRQARPRDKRCPN